MLSLLGWWSGTWRPKAERSTKKEKETEARKPQRHIQTSVTSRRGCWERANGERLRVHRYHTYAEGGRPTGRQTDACVQKTSASRPRLRIVEGAWREPTASDSWRTPKATDCVSIASMPTPQLVGHEIA